MIATILTSIMLITSRQLLLIFFGLLEPLQLSGKTITSQTQHLH